MRKIFINRITKNLWLNYTILLFIFSILSVKSQTYFMSSTGSGTMSGDTWENAMPFGQFPARVAELSFKNIYLKEGNYTLTAVAAIENSAGALVQGGFPSTASGTDISGYDPVAFPTIIGAVTNGAYIRINNRYHEKSVSLIGLAFTGNWGINNVILMNSQGSEAIPMYPLTAELKDLHLYNITSSTSEGYIQTKIMHPATRILIKNSLFDNNINNGGNVLGLDGAGFNTNPSGVQGGSEPYYAIIENNSFIGNRSNSGDGSAISTSSGGGSDLLIRNNYFCNNYSEGRGGALYFQNSNRIRIEGNVFNKNEARNFGSAIYILEGTGQTPGYLITNNTFYGNLPSSMPDLNLPRECCSGGASVGVTNNTFDKIQTATIIGNFNGIVKTPVPYTGNNYGIKVDPGSCPTNIGEPDIISDVFVTKTDGVTQYTSGTSTIYTIIVGNNGPGNISGVTVSDPVPSGIPSTNVSYIASVSGGAITTVSGTQIGGINDNVTIPVGGTITYTVTLEIPVNFTSDLVNTVSLILPTGYIDTDTVNNSATDINTPETISFCYKPYSTSGTTLDSPMGITSLARAGSEDQDNWPMARKGAWTVLEAKTKGFVVNRVEFSGDNNPVGIAPANFVEGMLVYDTTNNCLKMYTSTDGGTTFGWYCLETQTCPD